MEMTPEEYGKLVDKLAPKSPIWKNTALAFLVGGAICVLGQVLMTVPSPQRPVIWVGPAAMAFSPCIFRGL